MEERINIDELKQRIFNDDPIAYKELFLFLHSRLISFSVSITNNKEVSEEIVSDIFMKIWQRRSSIKMIENLRLYLYVSAKNLSINYLVKEKKNSNIPLDNLSVELEQVQPNPEQAMVTKEMMARLHQAVSNLPDKCKLIYKLVREDGFKYREVADLLGLSQKTVENQMAIAIRKISMAIRFNSQPIK